MARESSILYKYFPTSRVSFFLKPMIRYTPATELNDPFECRSSFKAICSSDALKKYIRYKKTGVKPDSAFFDLTGISGCFEELWDDEDVKSSEKKVRVANTERVQSLVKKRDECREQFGVLSLSANNNNPTMWAHYASEHKGFVIAFNEEHDFFAPHSEYDEEGIEIDRDKDYPSEVTYTTNWIKPYMYDSGFSVYGFMFPLQKSKSWSYEEEWRVIAYDVNKFFEYGIKGLVDCPPEAISGVYLGLSTSDEHKEIVKAFGQKYSHIEVQKAYLSKNNYEILFQPL